MGPKRARADAETLRLLDPEALSTAESLGMNARFIVEGYMAGEHRSPYHGFAIEFAQHREYAPGDDVRHLDWKVLGRTERHYIKQYEQETNFIAHLILDRSESMRFSSGDISKWHYAKMTAACLAYLILNQRDAVALALCGEALDMYLPRSDSRTQLFKILSALAAAEPEGGTRLGSVLDDVAVQLERKGIVIVISDFLDEDDDALLRGIQHLRFHGHEIIAFQVLDPLEIDFDLGGLVKFVGMEGLSDLETRPAEIRRSYLREFERHTVWLRQLLTKHHCHFRQIDTARPFEEVLSAYLAFRHQTVTT